MYKCCINIFSFLFCILYLTNLTQVNIGDGVEVLPPYLLYNCRGLTSVTIPNSVISIGNNAFYNVNYIQYYGTATGAKWGALYMNGYIEDEFIYKDSTKSYLITCTNPNITITTIPESVDTIASNAFSGCTSLTTLNWNAKNCTSVGSSYSSSAFYNLTSLTQVNIGDSVEVLPYYFLYGCSGLTSVTIPNSVASIGSYAFRNCSGLTSVTIGNSITSIEDYAFYNCSGLTSVAIGKSVTSIGSNAFNGCNNIQTLNWNAKNCATYNSAFSNKTSITSLTIGDSVQVIPSSAFS
ncbi:MAG: leucine-rich repeat domain-containing protein, partial [Bacteroidales bacterium]|nr:leucine-rich repeat domain-containing protein [Bacteroidales bacterium]